jgi:hypothetical protein
MSGAIPSLLHTSSWHGHEQYTFSKCLINIADYGVMIMRFGHRIESFLSQNVLSCLKFERCYRVLLLLLLLLLELFYFIVGDIFDICQHKSFQNSILCGFKILFVHSNSRFSHDATDYKTSENMQSYDGLRLQSDQAELHNNQATGTQVEGAKRIMRSHVGK